MERPGRSPAQTELGVFLRALWRRRLGIAAGTLAAGILAALAAWLIPPQYEARARLAIADFRLQESMAGEEGRETFAARVSMRETYASLVDSQSIAQRIVEEFGLDEEFGFTAEGLLQEVDTRVVPNTAMLVVTVTLPDPGLAHDVCLAFARAAEELSHEVNEADRDRVEEVLRTRLETVETELDRVEAELAEAGGMAAIRALEAELELHIDRRDTIEQKRIDVLLRAAGSDGPGTRAALDLLDEQSREVDARIEAARTRLAERAPRLRRLESEFETALETRAEIARRLESSEITVAGQIAELTLVDPPVAATPAGPGALLIVPAGLFLGLILSVLVAAMAAGLETTAG